MKIINITFLSVLFFYSLHAQSDVKFGEYFADKTMRIDYYHTGNAEMEFITIDKIYAYGTFAGSLNSLIDRFNQRRYYFKVYDVDTEKLIFSKGFDSYFGEYKLSSDAIEGKMKTYHETAIIPFPLNKIRFAVELRNRENLLQEIFSAEIDPENVMIIRQEPEDPQVKVIKLVYNGNPHSKVDVVILGEGYTSEEESKFLTDLKKFSEIFISKEPYSSLKESFNIYGVLKPSLQSGTDEPRAGIFRQTVLNTTFNSLGSERYLLTEDNKSVHDLAAFVPYDAIYIMVNHRRYGGGGIYNFFCTFTSDNQFNDYLFLHEFGHSFTGLADEYYTSSTAYNDFYPRGIEPLEPNITALLNPPDVKWKDFVTPGIEIPTPWEKAEYDKMDYAWQKLRAELNNRIALLKKTGAPADEIKAAEEEYALKDREHSELVDKYLRSSKYAGLVGAFEGAGYSSEGLFRPMLDCIMFSKGNKPFCKVCEQAIIRVIRHYTE
ncbi:MAG: IgA Peptidase M64 [Ignavibacteriaceae bacterium]